MEPLCCLSSVVYMYCIKNGSEEQSFLYEGLAHLRLAVALLIAPMCFCMFAYVRVETALGPFVSVDLSLITVP